MNLEEIREQVSYVLNFTSDTPDQDFSGTSAYSYKRIDWAINQSYRSEYTSAVAECGSDPFLYENTDTWPSGQLLYTLPKGIERHQLYALWDVSPGSSNNGRGEPLWMGERTTDSAVVWRDHNRLEWGSTGPSSDINLLFQLVAEPGKLEEDTSSPVLFPSRFHDLFVWSSPIVLREVADERAPQAWYQRAQDIRHNLWKTLHETRPTLTGPRLSDPINTGYF